MSFTFFVSILYSAGTLAGISSCLKVVFHSVKIPRGQKVTPDLRTEHAQWGHFKNRTEKNEREKS